MRTRNDWSRLVYLCGLAGRDIYQRLTDLQRSPLRHSPIIGCKMPYTESLKHLTSHWQLLFRFKPILSLSSVSYRKDLYETKVPQWINESDGAADSWIFILLSCEPWSYRERKGLVLKKNIATTVTNMLLAICCIRRNRSCLRNAWQDALALGTPFDFSAVSFRTLRPRRPPMSWARFLPLTTYLCAYKSQMNVIVRVQTSAWMFRCTQMSRPQMTIF